jgi:hypothetical protein
MSSSSPWLLQQGIFFGHSEIQDFQKILKKRKAAKTVILTKIRAIK